MLLHVFANLKCVYLCLCSSAQCIAWCVWMKCVMYVCVGDCVWIHVRVFVQLWSHPVLNDTLHVIWCGRDSCYGLEQTGLVTEPTPNEQGQLVRRFNHRSLCRSLFVTDEDPRVQNISPMSLSAACALSNNSSPLCNLLWPLAFTKWPYITTVHSHWKEQR